MASSPDVAAAAAPLDPSDAIPVPGPLPTMLQSMRRAYHAEPFLVFVTLLLVILAAVPDALFALWLKFMAQGVVEHRDTLLLVAALGLGASVSGGWLLQVISGRVQRRFRMRVGVALEAQVAALQASVVTIEHQERPEYLDRLAVLRDQVYSLDHMYMALFSTFGAALRLLITVALLMSVHPAMGLLAAFAVPTVVVSSWRSGIRQRVEERAAPHQRLARHLFLLGTTAAPGKEVRLAGIGRRLVDERRAAWERWYRPVAATRMAGALWQAASWALFGAAYVGAVVFAVEGIHASSDRVLLVLAAGGQLVAFVAMTAGEADFLRMWLDASRRLGWLEAYAAAHDDGADRPVPAHLERGIRFEGVSFRYPGTPADAWVLRDVTLDLPAGAVVAIVGENGAGKTTLVKLLSRFYAPTAGHITVDGVDLQRLRASEWRERMAGAYQDFARFEFVARQTVGLGDVPRAEEPAAVGVAVGRAGAEDVVERLPRGLETQLGVAWEAGVEPSFGQWQKLALARGFMRDDPLLLVLDEPTAALDAETEHALFERFAAQSRAGDASGRITILVSHRFSTVRMADLIVVLDGARVAEVGTHEALMARGGTYAELYGIQARAYR